MLNILIIISALVIIGAVLFLALEFTKISEKLKLLNTQLSQLQENLHKQQLENAASQLNSLKVIQDSIQQNILNLQNEVARNQDATSKNLIAQIERMINIADKRLQEINQNVENKINQNFEKTNATFSNIIKRLALIDDAQKKITELSTNVVSLKDILSNRSLRGAFGEIQLETLVKNSMPSNSVKFQYTLSNQKRVDCLLQLPKPSGNIAIDAKFPLENYNKIYSNDNAELNTQFKRQFQLDIKKHIEDIASKYIIPGETAEGAMMFIPAEKIFADLHDNFPELIEFAQRKKVWIVSPTTMMAVLTTAHAVLKDAATRKQVHIIQHHLALLAKDFTRFNKRMDDLAKHIELANRNVEQVQTSAKKITLHFSKIDNVQLEPLSEEQEP